MDDLRGSPPAAVILFGDGINTDGPDLADAAHYAEHGESRCTRLALGTTGPSNVVLSDLLVNENVFVRHPVLRGSAVGDRV